MTGKRVLCFWLTAFSLATSHVCLPAQPIGQTLEPVVRQVDHILISSDDPALLFDFFTRTLQLPVAWPLADYEGFSSGGVGAGNVNLEVVRFHAGGDAAPAKSSKARFAGIAFEPVSLAQTLPQLKIRGIGYDRPRPYRSVLPDGSEGTSWTNVVLTRFSKPGLSVFLCEYNPAFLNVDIRRNQLGGQLVLNEGGPLGIRFVKEIAIGTSDLKGETQRWQRLFLPAAPSLAGGWQVGNGPAIRLISASRDGIRRIVVLVGDLRRARDFLEAKEIAGAVKARGITINPSAIQGLDIVLVER